VPPRVGDDRDGVVVDLHRAFHTRPLGDRRRVEAHQLAAVNRALPDRGIEHAGELQVDRVLLAAVELSAVSRRWSGLPATFQLRGSLSLIEFGSGGGSLAASAATFP
jgi:hypothetical protein